MKTQIKITDINHEDLVDLFSTALYDSLNFVAHYGNKDFAKGLKEEDDCFEDVLAKIAMNAKVANDKIKMYDMNAEDGEVYGSCACGTEEDKDYDVVNTYYYIGIKEITKGLEASANSNESYIRDAFNAFVNREEDSDWDAITADILMQMIVFGEVIYG